MGISWTWKIMGSLNADQLFYQLKKLKENLSPAEQISADKVIQNFLDLHLPVNSEVLELCSKTGLVSASVQTKGYFKVDVLNEDMPTLRCLQRNNLYRNYIWREVSGIGSTGLREESYDVVVTSGGFSSHAMSPNDITETLRILRPEGFMIWSMKTAQAEHSTEFGLFEQNLTGLVKSGKCTLVKHEMFTDKRNKTGGELYVVKRLAGHFPDYLDRPTPVELQAQIEQMLVDDADPVNTVKFYDDWSEKYDDDLVVVGNYNGYIKCADALVKLGLNHQVSILSFKGCFHGRTIGLLSCSHSRPIQGVDIPTLPWPKADFPQYKYPLGAHAAENRAEDDRCLALVEELMEKASQDGQPVAGDNILLKLKRYLFGAENSFRNFFTYYFFHSKC